MESARQQVTPWSVGSRPLRRWISQHRPEWQKATVTLGVLADGRWYLQSARHCWNIWQPYHAERDAIRVAERLAYGMHEEPVYRPVRLHDRTNL